jgi:DNA-binding SARP family transcriptional activator
VPAAPSTDTSRLPRLSLLSVFQLRWRDRVVPLPLHAQRLLAYLALDLRPRPRPALAGALWLDVPEHRAAANLRTALWRLRQVDAGVVECTSSSVRLGERVVVDVHDTLAAVRGVDGEGPATGSEVAELAAALRGDLLPDWSDDWVLVERERFRQLRLHALERLCRQLTRSGRFGEAIDAGLAAVEVEPLRESAQAALIEAHLAEGNVSEGLRQYGAYADLLWEGLGLEPSPALQDVVRVPRAPLPRQRSVRVGNRSR